jgi:hypothetical protein
MSPQKVLCLKQREQGSQSGLRNNVFGSRRVLFKPSPPILLPLTTDPCKPMPEGNLPEETQKNGKPDHLKAPIIKVGPQSMNRPTVGTTISPQTQRFRKLIEIPAHIPMAPQSWASAPRTPRRTRPWILLSDLLQELDIEITVQYQVRSFSGITEGSSPGRELPSVIPSLSPKLIVRRKKTYTTNGEILGRVLGKTM